MFLSILLAVFLSVVAVVSIWPFMMSFMMFDSPGSHLKITPWMIVAATGLLCIGTIVLAVVAWLHSVGLMEYSQGIVPFGTLLLISLLLIGVAFALEK